MSDETTAIAINGVQDGGEKPKLAQTPSPAAIISDRLLASVGGDFGRFVGWFSQRTFSPERQAESALSGAAAHIAEVCEKLAAMGATPEQIEVWVAGSVKRWAALQAAGSRTINWMITGPARFPVARNQKRMDVEHKRLEEWLDYAKGWTEWFNRQTRRAEKAALAEVSASTEHRTIEFPGVKLVQNTTLDRIQLLFDGKPESEVITHLKREAFRWSPREGAWQRQNTNNGVQAAYRILRALGHGRQVA